MGVGEKLVSRQERKALAITMGPHCSTATCPMQYPGTAASTWQAMGGFYDGWGSWVLV